MSTPTPRTDAATALTSQHRYDYGFGDPEFGWVTAGFARTLERELAIERARMDWLEFRGPWEAWSEPCGEAEITLRGPIRAAIDAAMKEGV